MATLSRWFAPAVLAIGVALAGLAPATAQAQSQNHDVARIIVDVADVAFRSGQPYHRHDRYGHNDRLVVVRDRYGRPVYYRNAPRHVTYHSGYRQPVPAYRESRCNRNGKCTVSYYDARRDRRYDRPYDRPYDRHPQPRYYGYDQRERGRGHDRGRGRGGDRD